MNRYSCDADDFYVNVNLNTEMELPTNRDTVLHFFEQMKKAFPELRNFYTRENGDLVLEGDKEQGRYRWLAIEPRRLCSGHVNPETLEDAYRQHEMVLDLAPHLLTISLLDCEALDVMYGFDFTVRRQPRRGGRRGAGGGPGPGGAARAAGGPGHQLRAVDHAGPRRGVPAPVPALDRDPDQRLPGPHRRFRRRPDQRLLHGPPVLGHRARIGPSSTRSAASASSARRSSRTWSSPGSSARWPRPSPRDRPSPRRSTSISCPD